MWCISFSMPAISDDLFKSPARTSPVLHQYHGRSCLQPWWTPSPSESRLDTGYPALQLSGHPLPFSLAKRLSVSLSYSSISAERGERRGQMDQKEDESGFIDLSERLTQTRRPLLTSALPAVETTEKRVNITWNQPKQLFLPTTLSSFHQEMGLWRFPKRLDMVVCSSFSQHLTFEYILKS